MTPGTPATFRPQALLSFPFFALGLVSFLLLVVWLLARPGTLLEVPRAPGPLGFVHLTILGWLASFVFGAAYQLIPVVSESPLWSRSLAWIHLGIHVAGVPLLLAAMVSGDFAAAGTWGGLVAAGVALGVVNLLLTASVRSRWTPENAGLVLALFWLLVTVVLGVLLALARTGRFPAFPPEHLLRLHMSCGVVGFFTGTLIAVSFKLVPMFLLGPVKTRVRAWSSVILFNSGLLLLGPGLLGGLGGLVAAAVVLVAAGVAAFLAEMGTCVRRRMRPLDWPLRSFFIGIGALLPATAAGALAGLAAAGFEVWQPARPGLTVFVLVVFGVLTPCILGMAGKIVPFLAWQWRYADHVGRARVPLVADLFRVPLLRAQCFALLPAVACATAGALLESPAWLRAGAAGFLLAAGTLGANVALLVPHLVRPRLLPLAVAPTPGPASAAGRPPWAARLSRHA